MTEYCSLVYKKAACTGKESGGASGDFSFRERDGFVGADLCSSVMIKCFF